MSDRLRVLFVNYDGRISSGATLSLLRLVTDLRECTNIEPVLAAPGPTDLVAAAKNRGLEAHRVKAPPWMEFRPVPRGLESMHGRIVSARKLAVGVAAQRALIDRVQPALVVTSTIVTPAAALAARRAGLPHVWSVHELPVALPGLWTLLPMQVLRRVILHLSELLVTPSSFVTNDLARLGRAHDIVTIPTGLEIGRAAQPTLSPAEGLLNVLALGRFERRKAADVTLDGFLLARSRGARIRLCVTGEVQLDDVPRAAALLRRGQAEGWVEVRPFTADPVGALDAADILVSASPLEALPRVVFEAMARGTPVIAARGGGALDIFSEGAGGRYFEPGSAASLAELLVELDTDRTQLTQLSAAAIENVRGRFEPTQVAEAFAQVLHSAYERHRAKRG